LTYGVGASLAMTNLSFLETMATNTVKPWTGTGCVNPWTVTFTGNNPFEQRTGANYGTGNANGLEFKGGTANLADSTISSAGTIDAGGSSGFVEFYLMADSQYGTSGWTFQINPGSGFATRLSELAGTNHAWQLYHYDLQSSELVSNLSMRFQFRGGVASNRVDVDQISLKVVTGGTLLSNVTMSTAGGGLYSGQIPAQPAGTAVSYSVTAWDAYGLNMLIDGFAYTVLDSADSVGDGTPDWWRARFFGGTGVSTNSQSCATCDPDGDGMENAQEYLADTNPTNSTSVLALVTISPQTNGLRFTWIGGIDATQILECWPDLGVPHKTWTALFTNEPPTATTNSAVEIGMPGATNRFYRIRA
jgi:hypothetical protein